MRQPALCPLEHTDDDDKPMPKEAAPGLVLCRFHISQLRRDIEGLPGLYDELALMLHADGAKMQPKVDGQGETATFVNELVATCREQIVRTLTSWVVLVAEERGLHAPSVVDVAVLTGWLERHVEWIGAQPWADEPAGHFRELNGDAYRLAYPTGKHRVVCGRCLEVTACDVDTHQETRCAGSLVVFWTEPADLEPEGLDCSVCGKVWPRRYWSELGRRLQAS